MNNPLISILMPAYNAEKYIKNSINSILNQTYKNYELIIINDGSTDKTKEVVNKISDSRIRYFEQENKGVSAARNLGLLNMKGDYFCFLDADDYLPSNSLISRISLFEKDEQLIFADGIVYRMDENLKYINKKWQPKFYGNPMNDLVKLSGFSFMGLSWMIKRDKNKRYLFDENITHGEDLLFFLNLAREGGLYGYINETILLVRNTPGSAMKNLKGLENGYRYIENIINSWPEIDKKAFRKYKYRFRKSMALSYISNGQFLSALKQLFH